MERKDFLKLTCTGCMLAAAGLLSTQLLSSCGPAKKTAAGNSGNKPGTADAKPDAVKPGSIYKTTVVNKEVQVPVAQFGNGDIAIVRAKGMDYDIAVHRNTDNTYEAMLLECTHFSNPLVRLGDGYHCNTHGSEFDAHGRVTRGPASNPLRKFPVTITPDNITIHV